MIKGLWNRIKNDKILFAIFIFVCAVVSYDVFVLVFDIVQFVIISNNRPALANSFATINVIASVLNLIAVATCILYAIFRKK